MYFVTPSRKFCIQEAAKERRWKNFSSSVLLGENPLISILMLCRGQQNREWNFLDSCRMQISCRSKITRESNKVLFCQHTQKSISTLVNSIDTLNIKQKQQYFSLVERNKSSRAIERWEFFRFLYLCMGICCIQHESVLNKENKVGENIYRMKGEEIGEEDKISWKLSWNSKNICFVLW